MLRAKGYWIGGGLCAAPQKIVSTLFTVLPAYNSWVIFFMRFLNVELFHPFSFMEITFLTNVVKLDGDPQTEKLNLQALTQITQKVFCDRF